MNSTSELYNTTCDGLFTEARVYYYAPWTQQPRSAFAFVYFACATIGVAMINFALFAISDRLSLSNPQRKGVTPFLRAVALLRSVLYRKPRFLFGYPVGATALIVAFSIFVLAWIFSVHPYYGTQDPKNGSPPLAVRAGWFVLSTTPFIYALAVKKNPISALTGMSYESLSFYHRWLARIALVITLIHAIPFFVRAYQRESLAQEWNASRAWWTGIVAFFILLWMTISSVVPLRRVNYEFFVFQHIVSAIAYLVFVFLHTRDLFTSWLYCWATVAIYGGAIVARSLCAAWWNLATSKATVTSLPDKAIGVRLQVPTMKGQWKPGQHIFIRFLALSPFQSHPFTIASIEEDGELILIIKQRGGLTKKLYDRVSKSEEAWMTRVIIDGPYGGPSRDPGSFDTVVLIAGGVGVTYTLPLMKDLVRRMSSLYKLRCSKIIFVWSVPTKKSLMWLHEEIGRCAVVAEDNLQIKLFVTKSTWDDEDEDDKIPDNVTIETGRPPIKEILSKAFGQNMGRMCVFGAGPERMMADIGTEVAKLQGMLGGSDTEEVYMHLEIFAW